MKYFLVNGGSAIKTGIACTMIKYDLTHWFGRDVEIVKDGYSSSIENFEDYDLMSSDALKPHQKLSMILERRKKLMTEQILPAMNSGKIVLYAGGLLDDGIFVDEDVIPFQTILKENLEMLQSIGGVAYPTGTIHSRIGFAANAIAPKYEARVDLLASAVSRLKRATYGGWEDLSCLIR